MSACRILASALPGFRDLRAPVITGYVWLLFAWLLVKPDPNHKPTNALGAALYDLGHDAGRIWITVAISVAAYFVGSLSLSLSDLIRLGLQGNLLRLLGGFQFRREEGISPIYHRAMLTLRRLKPTGPRFAELQEEVEQRAKEAESESLRELDLPAILLIGDQSELFAEVDRLRAEGELRMGVAPPLIALSILGATAVSIWWLAAAPAAMILFLQGAKREIDAKKSIADAIRRGRVPSSAAAKFTAWVDQGLPQAISDARAADS